MEEHKYYNKHTIYVKSDYGTNEQLIECLEQSLIQVSNSLKLNVSCKFKSNLICDNNGNHYGYGFLWVTNPQVYYMLIGKNPDGSSRLEYYDDPSWTPSISSDSKSWADISDNEPPKLSRNLPPLMTLPPFTYSKSQKNILNTDKSNGFFQLSPAYVTDIDPKFSHYILCCRGIPNWINENDLKNCFIPYASDSTTKIPRKIKNKRFYDTYPFVSINDKKIAFITFDSTTRDAQFCLLMMRKTILVKENNSCELVFNHSYNSF